MDSDFAKRSIFIFMAAGLAAGGIARLAGAPSAAQIAWGVTTGVALALNLWDIVRQILERKLGVDIVAALALIGSVALGEYLAGAVIGLMLATGQALENYAAGRAERELASLVQRAPRFAHRVDPDGITTVPIDEVRSGDRLLVKEADVIPVDGAIVEGAAVLDESALTGESRLVNKQAGDRVSSGTVNAGRAFEIRSTATADESTYAGIIRLVKEAQASKAPFVRLADRYAAYFVPITLVIAGVAWGISGDAVRALAVLVVATPCPLLLAAPIAVVGGISRCASRGIVVKGGGALEALALGQVVYLDKTGTLTVGAPRIHRIEVTESAFDSEDLLRDAASLDQASSHVLAAALVRAARERGTRLSFPDQVQEFPGDGILGTVNGRRIALGNYDWVVEQIHTPQDAFRSRMMRHGGSAVFIAVDGALAGAFLMDDPVRPDTPRAIRSLRRIGIQEVVMVTGDHPDVAESVGAALGVDRVLAERSPEEKIEAVRAAAARKKTIMIGDGINDAPALAAAHVGIAMGARGATASSESADVVIVIDRLDRVVEGVQIARHARSVAVQSALVGMGLSFVAMGVAAFGLLVPVAGAALQEVIDVVAIVSALRALRPVRLLRSRAKLDQTLSERLRSEHRVLIPQLDRFRIVADDLGALAPLDAKRELDDVRGFLNDTLIPHERADETEIYPTLERQLPGDDPLGSMSRSHQEIFHLARLLNGLVDALPETGPEAEDLTELRRVLYALHAVLVLHFSQEEELYLSMSDTYLEESAPTESAGSGGAGASVASKAVRSAR